MRLLQAARAPSHGGIQRDCVLRMMIPNAKFRAVEEAMTQVATDTSAVITPIEETPSCPERLVILHCPEETAGQPSYLRYVCWRAFNVPRPAFILIVLAILILIQAAA